jgi:hypothetical protein
MPLILLLLVKQIKDFGNLIGWGWKFVHWAFTLIATINGTYPPNAYMNFGTKDLFA